MRNPLRRGVRVPAAVLRRAGVPAGDKVLAGALAADGTWLLGTRSALHIVAPAPSGSAPSPASEASTGSVVTAHVVPWQQVETADWDGDTDRLRVSEVGEFNRVRPVHVFTLEDPGLLLALVRERVTASVVLQRRVVVAGTKGFFVVARRSPTGRGDIGWAYEFDAGVDPDDPEVRRLAEAALRTAAEEIGL